MKIVLLVSCLTLYAVNAHSITVREWWVQCKGNSDKSTCLTESELSKFKTICSNKSYKEDCKMVVDYVIARTRVAEAKALLLDGYTTQISNFSASKKYLNDIEKIWNQNNVESKFSFAVGVLPRCNMTAKKKLVFDKNLRSEVKEFQNTIIKIYESLMSLPCPDVKNGFVLVAIGKVIDSKNEFEIFTVDENKNFKIINSALGLGPFISKN